MSITETNTNKYEISIIIPYLNNPPELHKNILLLKNKFNQISDNYEIILVDDYSEKSVSESIDICKELCKYVRNNSNKGKGYSVKRGVSISRGDIIFFIDSDLPYNLDNLDMFLQAHKEGYDIAIGDRTLENSVSNVKINFLRKIISILYRYIARIIIKGHFDDTQCGMKSFTRNAADIIFPKIRSNGFAFDVEILMIAQNTKLFTKKIPVNLINNSNSTTKFIKDGISTIFELAFLLMYKSIYGGKRRYN